ncbi:MAG: hypothetical protein JST86_05305 [Bacteroidetes bacterium]|nr:hypothetical protein [Bacteroidota bacterium]
MKIVKNMRFLPGNVYHIYNQGNNNTSIFIEDVHFNYFLELYRNYVVPHCETLSWCLMHTHFHFMIYADERCLEMKKQGGLILDPVTNGFRKLLSAYAHEFNVKQNRTGSLFRPKTKSICLDDEMKKQQMKIKHQNYYRNTFEYIHNNPVEAGLARHPTLWKWSSCRFYEGLRPSSFCNRELALTICGISNTI